MQQVNLVCHQKGEPLGDTGLLISKPAIDRTLKSGRYEPRLNICAAADEVAHTRRRSQSRRRSRFDKWSMAQYRIFIIYGRDLSARQGIIKANAPLGLSVTEWPEPPLNFDLVGDAGMHHRLCRK